MNEVIQPALKAKDYATNQEVRWCPGCGDYAIIKAVQKTMADIGADPANTVFVSGIGCAARFPYYMETFGFHTIHGRAPSFATGIKLVNPDLDVWVVGGDGDGLSIGGNHTMHAIRRNVDITYLLFNNEIYGLTKGQYSPTSRRGTRSPSTPDGSIDSPVNALSFALGANARFVARGIDRRQDHLPGVLARAHSHKGCSFVEVIQNCIVYNDGAFEHFTEKDVRADTQIECVHGELLLFGQDKKRGLHLNKESLELETAIVGENGITEDDIIVHDETNRTIAGALARMEPPHFPMAIGVLYCDPADQSYEKAVLCQNRSVAEKAATKGDMNALLRRGATWDVAS